jgi:hypothetical protein
MESGGKNSDLSHSRPSDVNRFRSAQAAGNMLAHLRSTSRLHMTRCSFHVLLNVLHEVLVRLCIDVRLAGSVLRADAEWGWHFFCRVFSLQRAHYLRWTSPTKHGKPVIQAKHHTSVHGNKGPDDDGKP